MAQKESIVDKTHHNSKSHHTLILDNRKLLTLSGISDVDSFDESSVIAYTGLGELNIKGKNLHIEKLNLDVGEMVMSGDVMSMIYSNKQSNKGKGILSKLFK